MAIRKKKLFVVEAVGGGAFMYIVDLANELAKNFDMYIAYAVRPQTPSNYMENFDKNIRFIEVKDFTRSINPLKDFKAILKVEGIVKEVRPDIIHLHFSKAGVIGYIAFNGKDVPLFYTSHGYSFLMENVMAKRNCTTISCFPGEHQETLKLTKKATYMNNEINRFVCKNVDEFRKAIQIQETTMLIESALSDIDTICNTFVMGEKYAEIYEGRVVLHELVFIRVYGLIAVSEKGSSMWPSAREAVAA